tara:strand:+ start:3216 stop:3812 length:597 start_codon:yes stop_codon:yes gene_type:complete
MFVFVYGTLKMGGHNHHYLKDSKFVQHFLFPELTLIETGYGFPAAIMNEGSSVYGEIYQINNKTLLNLDRLEGEGSLYFRKERSITLEDLRGVRVKVYIWGRPTHHIEESLYYWDIDDSKVLFNVIVDGRKHTDTADKIVFHMRFFDGELAPTNKDYMELVKLRSKLDLKTESEAVFLRDCILRGIVKEHGDKLTYKV